MLSLSLDYLILVFCVCAGVIQITAAYSGLKGLLLLPSRRAAYALGLALPSGAFAWFVYVGDTGIPGDLGGIEGSEQFALFLLGAAVATALTASLASLLHMKGTLPGQPQPGMEGLRDGTLLQLLILRIRSSRRDAGRR